jgi:hypothetical protein
VTFLIVTSTDAMSDDSGNLAKAILRSAVYAVNLARFVNIDTKLEALAIRLAEGRPKGTK